MHRIEVRLKPHLPDPVGLGLVKDIHDLGINAVSDARVVDIYWLDAILPAKTVELICRDLLADNVTQDYAYDRITHDHETDYHVVEVAYNPGVTDPVEDSLMKALRDLGVRNVKAVKTAKRYLIKGKFHGRQLEV